MPLNRSPSRRQGSRPQPVDRPQDIGEQVSGGSAVQAAAKAWFAGEVDD